MSDPRWERIKVVFEAALAVPEEDRPAILDLECGGDPELRSEVDSLLAARTHGAVRTAGAAHAMARADARVDPRERPGEHVGRYKLLQIIGEGGFGTVWLAEQREPVRRRVALKIIKLGMDTRQVVARFEAERQALATMDHPNIAKVLDAGATEAGRPYFVMEYIKGVPICEYCDAASLDTTARLQLFGCVCNAIQHAHLKGIIHRDIKPSNVLVTLHDGMPVPKVIDFGIAKATDGELTARTLFTEHRQLIGTPAYMSPEQAEMSGLDIDSRSDIYSLGVLLYELLTGTTPFDTGSLLQAGLAEMMRIIREVEPPKPSTRLSSLGSAATQSAGGHGAGAVRARGLVLRGDLDWIVMKCLEKDRTRRYDTASGLAADILRHLSHEPVTAGPPGAAYRLRKFMRRHRTAAIAVGVVATALVLGMAGTTAGMMWALGERDAAEAAAASESAARLAAQRSEQTANDATLAAEAATRKEAAARARAEAITRFVTAALQAGDAENAAMPGGPSTTGHDTTILSTMGQAIRDLDSGRFKDDPETEAALRHTIGTILRNNGQFDTARPLLERALSMHEQMLGGDSQEVAADLTGLAILHQLQGELARAEPLYLRSLQILERIHGKGHPATAGILASLGALHRAQGNHVACEALLTQAMESVERAHGPEDPDLAAILDALGALREAQGNYPEAEALHRRAIAIKEKAFGPGSYKVARSIQSLAGLFWVQGKTEEAVSLWRRCLPLIEQALGPDHPTVAITLSDLALAYRAQGRLSEAEPLFLRALSITERGLAPTHPHVLAIKENLASLRWSQGAFEQSVPMFQEVVQAREAALGRHHPSTLHAIANLGINYKDSGRLADAIPLLEEAYRASTEVPSVAFAGPMLLDAYARGADAMGPQDVARAEELLRELIAVAHKRQPKESLSLATDLAVLGASALALKAWNEAEQPIREALAIREAKVPDDWRTFSSRALLGGVMLGQGRLAEAEPLLLDGCKGMEDRESSIPAIGKARLTDTIERIVQLYEAKGDQPTAAAWRQRLAAIRRR